MSRSLSLDFFFSSENPLSLSIYTCCYILFFSHSFASLSFSPTSKVSAFFCLSLSLLKARAETQRSELVGAMDDDWDLQAVVRGCYINGSGSGSRAGASSTATSSTTTTTSSSSVFMAEFQPTSSSSSLFSSSSSSPFGISQQQQRSGQFFLLTDPNNIRSRNVVVEELHELYKPFFPKSQTQTPLSSFSSICSSSTTASTITSIASNNQIRQLKQLHQPTKQSHHNGSTTTPRSKKR